MTPNPKILIPNGRIALSFSNLAAPITACCKKLGIILKSQNKFLKHKAFYSDRLRNVKVKAIPLQAWSGPEGSRKLRFPDYMTTAQDGGKVVSLTHRPPLPSGNTPGTHFC